MRHKILFALSNDRFIGFQARHYQPCLLEVQPKPGPPYCRAEANPPKQKVVTLIGKSPSYLDPPSSKGLRRRYSSVSVGRHQEQMVLLHLELLTAMQVPLDNPAEDVGMGTLAGP